MTPETTDILTEDLTKTATDILKKPDEVQSNFYYIKDLKAQIQNSATQRPISTGFKQLDAALDGGLYEGLYLLGAVPSAGKTTFVLQIADNIAKQAEEVLFFSLEMSRFELMGKSISRESYEYGKYKGKNTRGILSGYKYSSYNDDEKAIISHAIDEYAIYSGNIFVHEGKGEMGVQEIRQIVEAHMKEPNRKPVIFVDYMQILAPYNVKYSDKQNTDKAVLELKRISRDYGIPVVVISSFNRANYKEELNMSAFKESGGIEYSSDVLIGIQYPKENRSDEAYEKMKQAPERPLELVILKNRNGVTDVKYDLTFAPEYNFFKEGKTYYRG